ncbi:PREDICTED: WD repeat-containing protein 75 [Cyprinodon variegatus]|uniref:WD repeat-containing protein 75 n=1 Tax=Cyprinodon variegatus TaxID=28743 RepID=UPI000742C733|nr:PREDICTED: WD repeat-containing protein 75 [Cyprinodon variegatus]
MVEESEIRVVHQGGSKITFRKPLISSDSRFLLCASGHHVKVFSILTEECVQELRGHTDLVTGLLPRASNHLQIYSCSVDGTIRLWDFTDGVLIKTFAVGYPIYSFYGSSSHQEVLFIVTPSQRKRSSDAFQLLAVRLPQRSDPLVDATDVSVVLEDVGSNPAAVSFGREGEYVASAKDLQLQIFFFKKEKSYRFSLKEDNKKGGRNTFTCVTCHPKDDCVASGHEDGKIRLWRNFNHRKEYTYSTLHWHHSAISSLCFTPEGTNLLSGGVESVLVQWRYKQESQLDYLPRLGAAITHIAVSPDGTLFSTSHSDNKITLIHGGVKVSAIIQGLVQGESVQTDLLVDPRSKALVLNGKPGHLQFYSLQRDKLLFNLDVVQQEFIHQSGLAQFQVVQAAMDGSGSWLATVEERKQKAAQVELNLKLWAFDEQTQSFVLNTTIWAPHEAGITSMCFEQAGGSGTALLVSSSRDGHFKAWQLAAPAHTDDGAPSWSCDFVGAYHGLVPERCCFSADGSLLAVSFQEVVTVWSPTSWELLVTLSQPPGAIRDLCFGRLSCSKYLLATTRTQRLCCWNLLTCSLEWTTPMDADLLLADPLSENMAAFCHRDGSTDCTSEC